MDPTRLMANLEPHRRRSVDVGGLALALGDHASGQGWGGWEERDKGEIRLVRQSHGGRHCLFNFTNINTVMPSYLVICTLTLKLL